MHFLSSPIRFLLRNERGTALVEYSSLVLLVALAAIALLAGIGAPTTDDPRHFGQPAAH